MTREEAIALLNCTATEMVGTLGEGGDVSAVNQSLRYIEALDTAISALREQEERNKACPYCDIAKANEGVRNTVLWVKEPETNKCTMMGKKLLFCPMCGRRLEDT